MADPRLAEIDRLLTSSGKSVRWLAGQVKSTDTTIHHILDGTTKNPRDETIVDRMLAALRNLPSVASSVDDIVGGLKEVRSMPMVKVPIVGSASAGEGSYNHPEFGEDIEIPAHMSLRPSAAYVASGDSMMPWIHPGDIVVARLHQEPKPNHAMLVRRKDGTVSVKFIRFDNGWKLFSLNPSYVPEPAEVEYMGYVTGIYRVNGTRVYMEFDTTGLKPEF